jgi:hypothetical protein
MRVICSYPEQVLCFRAISEEFGLHSGVTVLTLKLVSLSSPETYSNRDRDSRNCENYKKDKELNFAVEHCCHFCLVMCCVVW